MTRQELISRLGTYFKASLDSLGLTMVDFMLRYEGGQIILKVLVDKPSGGITLSECADLNRSFRGFLDEEGLVGEDYILEVSSPGLDRPLKVRGDFLRMLNKEVRFFLSEPLNGKIEWSGFIESAEEEKVLVRAKEGLIEIPYNKINKSKLII
ncbi:MAG: ribosome maturation factor RimP [Candidatus Omnitrophota bacterium]